MGLPMIRCLLALAWWLVVAVTLPTAAKAASVIFHSAPENAYGLCAGYPMQQANRCAETYCKKNGGSACRYVVGCPYAGAVAFSERPARAFGASCWDDEVSARRAALIGCITAANTVCRTDASFSSRGRELDPASRQQFDRVWLAQIILQIPRLYDGPTDGVMGEKIASAIRTFQQRLGRLPTGVIDEELLQRLVDTAGGPTILARRFKRSLLPIIEKGIADARAKDRLFYTAVQPSTLTSFGQDLMNRSPEARNLALATYLSARNSKCMLPARNAQAMSETIWNVTCNEGTYTLLMTGEEIVILGGQVPGK